VTPCSTIEVHQRFGRTYCLQLQGQRAKHKRQADLAGCLHGLLFDPVGGGRTFLRNVGEHLPDCTADYSSLRLKSIGSELGLAVWASYRVGCHGTQGRGVRKGTRLEPLERPISGAHWFIVTLDPWEVHSFSLFYFPSVAMNLSVPCKDRFCPFLPIISDWLPFFARSGVPWIPSSLVYITKSVPEAVHFGTEDGGRLFLGNVASGIPPQNFKLPQF
jgi:hypothetical protein